MIRFLQLLLLLHAVHAVTTIHYYHNPSCNTGTDVGSYDAPTTPTASDPSCHAMYNQTRALYINGLDTGCAVLTFSDTMCTPSSANTKLGAKGECYFLDTQAAIGSWRAACGSNLTAIASSSSGGTASSTTGTASATATVSETAGAAQATAKSAAVRHARTGVELAALGFGVVGIFVGATGSGLWL